MSNELSFEDIESSLQSFPVLKDKPDLRDYRSYSMLESPVGAGEMPESFSLRDKMTPVKSQGARGTCSAHAGCAILEYFHKRDFNEDRDLSEEFLFDRTKVIDIQDYKYDGYGAYVRSVCKAMKKYGSLDEHLVPYQRSAAEDVWKTWEPTEAQLILGAHNRVDHFISVPTNDDEIKKSLIATQAPLTFAVQLYSSYRNAKTNGGIMPVPTKSDTKKGGHIMVCTGWKKIGGKLYWEIKNSWGNAWGDKGYVWYPAEDTDNIFGIYAFTDLTTNPHSRMKEILQKKLDAVPTEFKSSFEKAQKKGLASVHTNGSDPVDAAKLFVFLDRAGVLDKMSDK